MNLLETCYLVHLDLPTKSRVFDSKCFHLLQFRGAVCPNTLGSQELHCLSLGKYFPLQLFFEALYTVAQVLLLDELFQRKGPMVMVRERA